MVSFLRQKMLEAHESKVVQAIILEATNETLEIIPLEILIDYSSGKSKFKNFYFSKHY